MREAVESDAIRITNYEQRKRSTAERNAINAFIRAMDTASSDFRDSNPVGIEPEIPPSVKEAVARLRELRIDFNRVIRELQLRNVGTEYERRLRQNRTRPDTYKGLLNYGEMGK